jgi:copper homeostasis protein
VRAIASETPLPLRVMLRENAGYGTDAAELLRMCDAAATFAAIGVDGLVVGFARGGQIMLDALQEVLQAARTVPATFHRAFDSLADPLRAIDTLSAVPQIDRVLTDGMTGPDAQTIQRCVRLREYADRAGSRLTVIAGSGVDEAMLAEIARTRCVREVHVGRAAREGGQGTPVTAARVRRLRELID